MATKTTITGPDAHPLDRYIDDLFARIQHQMPQARLIYQDHLDHATSDQTVYGVDDGGAWHRVGPVEDHGDLLNQSGHIAVTGRTSRWTIAESIAEVPGLGLVKSYREAAESATPMAAALLALCLHRDIIEWDTSETINAAARRLGKDAALRAAEGDRMGGFGRVSARDIYARVHSWIADAPAARPEECAQIYLTEREGINATLNAAGIRWGGKELDSAAAAKHVQVVGSTWRAYVSRSEAPAADSTNPPRWRRATLDAWLLTRPRTSRGAWN